MFVKGVKSSNVDPRYGFTTKVNNRGATSHGHDFEPSPWTKIMKFNGSENAVFSLGILKIKCFCWCDVERKNKIIIEKPLHVCKNDRSVPRPILRGHGAVLSSINFVHWSLKILRISPRLCTLLQWQLYILRDQDQIGNIPLDVCKKARLGESEAETLTGQIATWLYGRAGWRRWG